MSEKLNMKILMLPNGSFQMDYEPDDTVQYLKNRICQREEFRAQDYDSRYVKLVCDGTVLENEQILKDCEINTDSHILLVKQKTGKIQPPKRKDLSMLGKKGFLDSFWSLDSLNDPFNPSPFSRNRMLEPTIKPHNPRNHDTFLEAPGPRQRDPFLSPMNGFGNTQFRTNDASNFGMNPGSFGNISVDGSSSFTVPDNTFKSSFTTENASSSSEFPEITIPDTSSQTFVHRVNPSFSTKSQFPSNFGGSSSFSMGSEFSPAARSFPQMQKKSKTKQSDKNIQSLVEFGFTNKQAKKALKLADYDLETAIGLLTAGSIPDDEPALPTPPSIEDRRKTHKSIIMKAKNSDELSDVSSQSEDDDAEESNDYQISPEAMRQSFNQLKNDPQQLQQLKETVKLENPQLAKMIDENPNQFFNLIEQYSSQAGGTPASGFGADVSGFEAGASRLGNTDIGDRPPTDGSFSMLGRDGASSGSTVIDRASGSNASGDTRFTPSQEQAIKRIEDMGFERSKVIEAYTLCYKNEEMAVNYLLNAT